MKCLNPSGVPAFTLQHCCPPSAILILYICSLLDRWDMIVINWRTTSELWTNWEKDFLIKAFGGNPSYDRLDRLDEGWRWLTLSLSYLSHECLCWNALWIALLDFFFAKKNANSWDTWKDLFALSHCATDIFWQSLKLSHKEMYWSSQTFMSARRVKVV